MKKIAVRFKKISSCTVEIEVPDNFHVEDYGRGDVEPMVKAQADHWDDDDDRQHCDIMVVSVEDRESGEKRTY